MELIRELIALFRILIVAGSTARILYCLVLMAANQEETNTYKKRICNILVFLVFSVCAMQLLNMVIGYYGGDPVQ